MQIVRFFWVFTLVSGLIFPGKASAQSQGFRKILPRDTFDVAILMATPGGIAAGVTAARMGLKVALIERTDHVGGLPANGLGATDIHTKQLAGGFFKEFTDSILSYYRTQYGPESPQVKDCARGFHFEPTAAEKVLETILEKEKNLHLFRGYQFDAEAANLISRPGFRRREMRIFKTAKPKKERWIRATVFVDASYEGDLAAAMGCRFRTHRESKEELGEAMAGRIYKLWGTDSLEPGSTGEGDTLIQAYNYRLCITKDPKNKVDIEKPREYNRSEFVSLADDIKSGFVSGFFPKNGKTAGIVNPVRLPNGKYDANNHHRGLISTDLPEENVPYPTASWAWRDQFAKRLRSYTEGLLYFAQNDTAVPLAFREDALQYGWARDEYRDNGHFPRQLYVREARRIEGKARFTAHDALAPKGLRPRVHRSSVTSSHYAIDSHAMRKREKGHRTLDGFISYHTEPFTVPFEIMIPVETEDLICPVPVSASHLGFGCLRMEPCWMGLGHAAGVAAALAIQQRKPLSQVRVQDVQAELLRQKANLIYVRDVEWGHPDYEWVQKMALLGWFPGFEAKLSGEMEASDWEHLTKMTGIPVAELQKNSPGGNRGQVLKAVYSYYTGLWKNKGN